MDAAISLHWEFMGHGLTNSITLRGMPREQEASVIAQTRGIIEGYGQKMYGWLGPSLAETDDTLNLLRGEGAEYVADWVNDDLPYRMSNGLYSIPYTLELNDMPLFNMPSIAIEEFYRRTCETIDVLYDEAATSGRVMCIALHPFLIGCRTALDIWTRRCNTSRHTERSGSPPATRSSAPIARRRRSNGIGKASPQRRDRCC